MDFICLDKDYQNPIWLKPLNVQWYARHYENGEFSIQIPTSDYDERFSFIFCTEREQMGMIQKVFQENTLRGKFTQLSGFFLERLFHDYVVSEQVSCVDENICQYAAGIIGKFADQENLIIDDYSGIPDTVTSQITEGYLDDVLYELLKLRKVTYRIYYDFIADELHLKFVRGVNRTQSQTENTTIVFSEELKNLRDIRYTGDNSNYKNYAYVRGGDSETSPTTVIVDNRLPGERRREISVSASDLRMDEGIALAAYENQLRERGNQELDQYKDIQNIAFNTDNELVKYLGDYDCGDVVDIVVAEMGKAYESEIIEVNEVLKSNRHEITLVMGEKIPVKYVRR